MSPLPEATDNVRHYFSRKLCIGIVASGRIHIRHLLVFFVKLSITPHFSVISMYPLILVHLDISVGYTCVTLQ